MNDLYGTLSGEVIIRSNPLSKYVQVVSKSDDCVGGGGNTIDAAMMVAGVQRVVLSLSAQVHSPIEVQPGTKLPACRIS